MRAVFSFIKDCAAKLLFLTLLFMCHITAINVFNLYSINVDNLDISEETKWFSASPPWLLFITLIAGCHYLSHPLHIYWLNSVISGNNRNYTSKNCSFTEFQMGLVDLVLSRGLTDGWTIEHNNIVRAMTVLWSQHKTEICECYQLSAFLVPDDQVVSASHHCRVSRCWCLNMIVRLPGRGGEGHIVISHATVTTNQRPHVINTSNIWPL